MTKTVKRKNPSEKNMQERTFFVLTDPLATLGLLQCLVSHVLFPISIWFEIDQNSEFLSPVTLIAFVFWISRIVYLPSHSIFSLTLGHLPCLSQSERTRVCCIFDGLTEMSFLSHKIPYQTHKLTLQYQMTKKCKDLI